VPQAQPPRTNRGLIAAIAAAVLVLAVVGATAGWILAGRSGDKVAGPGSSPTPSATSVAPPTSEPPATPTATPTTTNTATGFRLPDVTNVDFEQARRQLRDLRLGVSLVFGQSGEDRTVARTEPAAGQSVRRGITVKLYVRGMAPYATIPGVVGLPCGQAGSIVADHGLVPQYPSGRTGVVVRTDPEQAPDRLRWNETLRVYCGTPPSSPAPG